MLHRRISGTTVKIEPSKAVLEAVPEMTPIAARVAVYSKTTVTQSAWEPTELEIRLLVAGGSLIITTASGGNSISRPSVAPPEDPETQAVIRAKRAAIVLDIIDRLIQPLSVQDTAQLIGALMGRVTAIAEQRGCRDLFIAEVVKYAQTVVLAVLSEQAQKNFEAADSKGKT
jgi:hypothetical protein